MRVSGEDFREAWPLWGEEMGGMVEFGDECKERSWTDLEGELAEDINNEDLTRSPSRPVRLQLDAEEENSGQPSPIRSAEPFHWPRTRP